MSSITHTNGLITGSDNKTRCWWPGEHADYIYYHDTEWGIPCHEDHRLFEKLCLEGFQSGLSWLTILRKRDGFRDAFANFNPHIIAQFTAKDLERLVQDTRIVRHRGKIEAVIHNAQRYVNEFTQPNQFSEFIWSFKPDVNERPDTCNYEAVSQLTHTPHSTALSKALKKRDWKYVGPTTCYAFMQSMGLVNDHIEGCAFRTTLSKAGYQG